MAKAIKCDCCGKFIEMIDGTEIVVLTRDMSRFEKNRRYNEAPLRLEETNSMELCSECDEAVGELLNSRYQAAIAKIEAEYRDEPVIKSEKEI